MTLQKVGVFNLAGTALAELLVMPGAAADTRNIIKSKGFIKNIDGLDPVNATLSTTANTTTDGVIFQDSSVGGRNIALTLGFDPDYTIGETAKKLRQIWYGLLPPKAQVILAFIDDADPTVKILGIVEQNTDAIFSEDPEAVITLLCPLPYFYEATNTIRTGLENTSIPMNYTGTAPTGFIASAKVSSPTDQITFAFTDQTHIGIIGNFVIGDVITINTIPKQRGISLTHKGVKTSLLDGLISGSLEAEIRRTTTNTRFNGANLAGTAGHVNTLSVTYSQKHIGL